MRWCSMPPMRREDLALIGVSTLVGLVLVEALLRMTGVGPWRPFPDLAAAPVLAAPDPALGWTNAPGAHAFGDHVVHVDSSRHRAVPGASRPATTWLVGGSFVFGYGLPDDATVAARLQALRPDLAVANHAAPGWGTVQSLLDFERSDGPVEHVVYGLVDLHDARNAAAWVWLHALDRSGATHAWKAVPSAWWDGASLHHRPPRAYRHLALSEHVAVVDLGERAWLHLRDRWEGRKSEATVQTVRVFRDAVQARGAAFTVVLLHAPRRAEYYLRRFAEEDLPLIDLRDPAFPREGALPDGHPDASMHARWAQQLAEVL